MWSKQLINKIGEFESMNTYQQIIRKYQIIKPSFREGIARVLDFGGKLSTQRVITSNPQRHDFEVIKFDWEKIGFNFPLKNHYQK